MKKILVFLTLLIFTFLVGCNLSTNTTNSTELSSESSTSNISSSTSQTTVSTTNSRTIETEISTTISEATETTTEEVLDRYQEIYFYSNNDFHGGAYTDYNNFSRIVNKIKTMKANNDHVIALTNGDTLQGTPFSNYYHGKPFIEAMNIGGFDGFVIGNHEFDWGIDVIADYKDGKEENVEADFPFLAANIVYKDTQEHLGFTVPYIISEVNTVRVGVIGVIGDVINSIAASRVENIEFLDPVTSIENYATHLRTEEDVDIVVVYIHNGSDFNQDIAYLSGDARVDAVFNGHLHWNEETTISRDGLPLAYAQVQSKDDSLLAEIKFVYDLETESLTDVSVNNFGYSELDGEDSVVLDMFNEYQSDTEYINFVNEVLTTSEGNYYPEEMAPWGASVIRDYLGIDIGAVNRGGFRVPMFSGDVTMGDLITIYPFDNVIKTSMMTGQQITDFYKFVDDYNQDVVFDDQLTFDGYTVYINGSPIDLDQLYTVGAVDYIFDKTNYDFIEGINIEYTGKFMRDLLTEDLLNSNGSFSPSDGSSYIEPLSYNYLKAFEAIV